MRVGRCTPSLMSICQGFRHDQAARLIRPGARVQSPCAGSEAGLKTTVDQTLMRGLGTAGPRFSSRSLLCQRAGVGSMTGHKRGSRDLLAGPAPDTAYGRVLPSSLEPCLVQAVAGGLIRWLMAQMKPTSSRAMAVITTFFGLPVAANRR